MSIASPATRRALADHRAIEEFWQFSEQLAQIGDSERLQHIKAGLSPRLGQAVRLLFNLPEAGLAELLNNSISTLERRRREDRPLDPVASERLDRIADITRLAEEIFETREAAVDWMSRPNRALGDSTPVLLCETEIGARQVRRVLHALDWGGVV